MMGYQLLYSGPFGVSQVCGVSFSSVHTCNYDSPLAY
jgi:hypothetical protein